MERSERKYFEFAGETFNLGEEIILTHKSHGYPNNTKDFLGVIEYISPEIETKLSGLDTYIKLDSWKHMIGLRRVEKIERVTDEKRELFYEKENERRKILNTEYKKIEIFLKVAEDKDEYVVTCEGKEVASGNTLQESITNFDEIMKK